MNHQGDVHLFQGLNGGDIDITNGIIEMSGGLETMVYLALFGGNEDDTSWWGNRGEIPERQYISKTQSLLRSLPSIPANLNLLTDAVNSDLAFLIQLRIASSITVNITIPGINRIGIVINIIANGIESSFNFAENWKVAIITTEPIDSVVSYTITPPPPSIPGGVSLDLSLQDTDPKGLFFRDNGSKFFMVGTQTNRVYQYTPIVVHNIENAVYDNISFDFTAQDTDPRDIFIGDNGNKLFMIGNQNNRLYQYTLVTPWIILGMTYDGISINLGGQDGSPTGGFFKDDGTKFYFAGAQNDRVYQYTLANAWTILGMTYDGVNFSLSTQGISPEGVFIGDNGSKMFTIDTNSDSIFRYDLPNAWSLTGANYNNNFINVSLQDSIPTGVFLRASGGNVYIVGSQNNNAYQYIIPTPWDLLTASY